MIVILIVALIFPCSGIEAVSCVVPNESRTRVFDSFLHFKKNRIPFSPLERNWRGSNVEFSSFNLHNLTTGTFTTVGSDSILVLKLSGKNITGVGNGAFVSLLCLKELLLDHNNVTTITRDVFQDLSSLQRLDLSYNRLETIKNLVFGDLARLKDLNLGHNHIRSLEVKAFTNLTSLVYLNLEKNFIVEVVPSLFYPLASLETLVLSWNRFRGVEIEEWRLGKLQSLELAGNRLRSFSPKRFLPLRSLNLSFNSLGELDTVELRKHLPGLEVLDLNHNPWSCDVLEVVLHEMHDSKVKFANGSSTGGVDGIACGGEVEVLDASTTTPANQERLESYVDRKIRETKEELVSSIKTLRIFVALVFVIVCVLILFEVASRTNVCRFLADKFRLEAAEDEDLSLMSRSPRHSHSHSHVL